MTGSAKITVYLPAHSLAVLRAHVKERGRGASTSAVVEQWILDLDAGTRPELTPPLEAIPFTSRRDQAMTWRLSPEGRAALHRIAALWGQHYDVTDITALRVARYVVDQQLQQAGKF